MLSFTTDAAQPMRLRDDPPPITQPARPSKKRKTPPTTSDSQKQHQLHQQPAQQPPPSQQTQPIQVLPPPHALMHPMPGSLPPGYPYAPSDYTPGGMPQTHPGLPMQQPQQGQQPSPPQGAATRTLSNSKRAEQNRKAQRAFRERRDQSVYPIPYPVTPSIVLLQTCQSPRIQIRTPRCCSCIRR